MLRLLSYGESCSSSPANRYRAARESFQKTGHEICLLDNWKYSRSGHLFQDRYKNELVEDGAYLLSVARYIHQNPVKAGLVANAADYPWSSAAAFLAGDGNGLVHGEEFLRLFAGNAEEQRKAHQEFLTKDDGIVHLEEGNIRVNDAQVRAMMRQLYRTDTVVGFQGLPINVRDGAVAQLHKEGASLRQLARLTGLTLGIIRKLV